MGVGVGVGSVGVGGGGCGGGGWGVGVWVGGWVGVTYLNWIETSSYPFSDLSSDPLGPDCVTTIKWLKKHDTC